MASTVAGAQLSDAHRRLQARLSARTVEVLLERWKLLDPAALDATVARWLAATVPEVARARASSIEIARRYQARFRATETDLAPIDLPAGTPITPAAVTTSLVTQGPVRIKALVAAGQPLATAARLASLTSAAAGTRHALDGGRQLLIDATTADPRAYGARRLTSAGCCAFCAMLAARSVDGLSSDFFKAHDNCHCQPETAYEAGPQAATRQAKEFHALYHDTTGDVSGGGNRKLNAFRQALAAQRAT